MNRNQGGGAFGGASSSRSSSRSGSGQASSSNARGQSESNRREGGGGGGTGGGSGAAQLPRVFANFTDPILVLTRWLEQSPTYWLVSELSDGKGGGKENIESLNKYFNWSPQNEMQGIKMTKLLIQVLAMPGMANAVQQDCVNRVFEKFVQSKILQRSKKSLYDYLLALTFADRDFATDLAAVFTKCLEKMPQHAVMSFHPFYLDVRKEGAVPEPLLAVFDQFYAMKTHFDETGELPVPNSQEYDPGAKKEAIAKRVKEKLRAENDGAPDPGDDSTPYRYELEGDPFSDDVAMQASALPRDEEIDSKSDLPVRTNPIVNGEGFSSVTHYLDTQWRLLRADGLEDIRIAIRALRSKLEQHRIASQIALGNGQVPLPFVFPRSTSFFAYTNVKILSFGEKMAGANNAYFLISFEMVTGSGVVGDSSKLSTPQRHQQQHPQHHKAPPKPYDWKFSRRMMPGSLVALSCDGFKTLLWGTIGIRDEKILSQFKTMISIEPESIGKVEVNKKYEMIETRAFWTAYRFVLERLAAYHFPREYSTPIYDPEDHMLEGYEQHSDPPPVFPLPDFIVGQDFSNNAHNFIGILPLKCLTKEGEEHEKLQVFIQTEDATLRTDPRLLGTAPHVQHIAENRRFINRAKEEAQAKKNEMEAFSKEIGWLDLSAGDGASSSGNNASRNAPQNIPPNGANAWANQARNNNENAENQDDLTGDAFDYAHPRAFTMLDSAQWFALKCILRQRVSVTQGPPGTGKTFLGLKATEILLRQNGFKGPILCICYTNHALDQFLEGILGFQKKGVVRMGGRSKSEILEPLNLAKLLPQAERNFSIGAHVRKRETARQVLQLMHKERASLMTPIEAFLICFNQMAVLCAGKNATSESMIACLLTPSQFFASRSPNTPTDKNGRPQRAQHQTPHYVSAESAPAPYAYFPYQHNTFGAFGAFMEDANAPEDEEDEDYADNEEEVQELLDERNPTDGGQFDLDILNEEEESMKGRGKGGRSREKKKKNEKERKVQEATSASDYHYHNDDELPQFNVGEEDSLEFTYKLFSHVVKRKIEEKKARKVFDEEWVQTYADPQFWEYQFSQVNVHSNITSDRLEMLENVLARAQRDATYFKCLSVQDTRTLISTWFALWHLFIVDHISKSMKEFTAAATKITEYQDDAKVAFLRKQKVIGMTTTNAARNAHILQGLGAKVIIIEEAAEIFEAHTVACLTDKVEKLILIGDHQQLRPKVSYYPLTKRGLDISLFERLILAGFPYASLRQQHRMHPEISRFIAPIYPRLFDGPGTSDRLHVSEFGLPSRTLFFTHSWPENSDSSEEISASKRNPLEATFIYGFARFLVAQGVAPEQVCIITMYQGQQRLLKRMMTNAAGAVPKEFGSTPFLQQKLASIRVTCVDDYQGEENEIIIVSLVRSNLNGLIGFVRTRNRICVALSRARSSMYVFGSKSTLLANAKKHKVKHKTREEPNIWPKILNLMDNAKCLDDRIVTRCAKHPEVQCIMKEPKDWTVTLSGCTKPCATQLECGHWCPQSCHSLTPHAACYKPCERIFENCQHSCPQRCYQECGDCLLQVEHKFPATACGHTIKVNCFRKYLPEPILCTADCERPLPCGHKCPKRCHQKCPEKCLEPVYNVRVPGCWHVLPIVACWKARDPELLRKEPHKCDEKLGSCTHRCQDDCFQCFTKHAPTQAAASVAAPTISSASSSHASSLESEKNEATRSAQMRKRGHLVCAEKCARPLPCSHVCQSQCGLPCPSCTLKCPLTCAHGKCDHPCGKPCTPCMEKCKWRCEHFQCDGVCSDLCQRPPCNNPCPKLLKCEHPCIGLCGEECPTLCRVCDGSKLVFGMNAMEVELQTEEADLRYIWLKSCKHVIEVEIMDSWIRSKTAPSSEGEAMSAELLRCPQCKSTISSDFGRYGNAIKSSRSLLETIRIRYQKDEIRKQYEKSDWKKTIALITQLHARPRTGRSQFRPPPFVDMLVLHASALVRSGAHDREVERILAQINDIDPNNEDAKKISDSLVSKAMPSIVAALSTEVKHGSWFKCPNGHPYVIGECGGAMEQAKCPECSATIGGLNHTPSAGNTHYNVDGSRYPAWSNDANLA